MANKGFVRFEMHVPIRVYRDGPLFMAACDLLDVVSQGDDEAHARGNLIEALQAFVETCHETGTLGEVLRQCGFERADESSVRDAHADDGAVVTVPLELVARRRAEARAN